VFLKRKLLKVK